jgi:chromosome segregation protein
MLCYPSTAVAPRCVVGVNPKSFAEVDMFLDGANIERLAKMIKQLKQQALQAQFIVVSLRRPMIESAERIIGVTQAREAQTQVLGIKLKPDHASA